MLTTKRLSIFYSFEIAIFAKTSAVYPGISAYIDNYFHIKLSYYEDITKSFWYDSRTWNPTYCKN